MLADILPIQTLQNVKDLAVSCWANSPKHLAWPTDWGQQLTGLTKLGFHFRVRSDHEDGYYLQVGFDSGLV